MQIVFIQLNVENDVTFHGQKNPGNMFIFFQWMELEALGVFDELFCFCISWFSAILYFISFASLL